MNNEQEPELKSNWVTNLLRCTFVRTIYVYYFPAPEYVTVQFQFGKQYRPPRFFLPRCKISEAYSE